MAGSKNAGDRYHHGNLRDALLRAAVDLIAERGDTKVSLRECARRAGVSHAAPYRHFLNKDALLLAIAEEGFARLHQAGLDAMQGLDDPRDRLEAYGVAYVRFAIQHPVHSRMMFTQQFDSTSDNDDVIGKLALDLLLDTASAVAGPNVDPLHVAIAAWSLSHGLSMLILHGRIPPEYIPDEQAGYALARSICAMWRGSLGR